MRAPGVASLYPAVGACDVVTEKPVQPLARARVREGRILSALPRPLYIPRPIAYRVPRSTLTTFLRYRPVRLWLNWVSVSWGWSRSVVISVRGCQWVVVQSPARSSQRTERRLARDRL